MSAEMTLVVHADHVRRQAQLHLLDANGIQLGWHSVDFQRLSVSEQRALFDLGNFLRHYVEPEQQATSLANVGVCIAERVLGEQIFLLLWRPESPRTLRIQLPGASEQDNHLAAALARIAWEIARPAPNQPSLAERNLHICVVHDMPPPASQALHLSAGEPLRVLFVFAHADGSRPLAARQERRVLTQLFERQIYPKKRVIAHYLSHGVTRQRLAAQIAENGGYHIVHWSGHGGRNQLELDGSDGMPEAISGQDLLALFNQAGGFLPRLFFLSACYSGDIFHVNNWDEFFSSVAGTRPDAPGEKSLDQKDIDLQQQPGYTGTAHALLQGGVPAVVAMRFAVGDEYSRELALHFYTALLAHAQAKSAGAALTMARRALLAADARTGFSACDHATPLLYGNDQAGIFPSKGRSPACSPHRPRLHQRQELSRTSHLNFVGRQRELAKLGAQFIASQDDENVRPIALITGLGGMGKTALCAEVLSLWEERFDWVLLYQAKPQPLAFEATLHDMHLRLMGELQHYYHHIQANPADAIYRQTSADFYGENRRQRLLQNLLRAMQDEAILLVLDNFETNLQKDADAAGSSACLDPAWDACLAFLAQELVGSASRVFITCRQPMAALLAAPKADAYLQPLGMCLWLPLGPLRPAEAALFLRTHPILRQMVFAKQPAERQLAIRILNASRFHPLLMNELAQLAEGQAASSQLLQVLDTLEKTASFQHLPEIFAVNSHDSKELSYLNDALATSIDELIAGVGVPARRLLWMIALANQAQTQSLLFCVWQEQSDAQQPIDCATQCQPLLARLLAVGLIVEERNHAADDNPEYACIEVVRERILYWTAQYPHEMAACSEGDIRLAYARHLVEFFYAEQFDAHEIALQAGSAALVYFVQAQAWEELSEFASNIVTAVSKPEQLRNLIPHLQTAAEAAPAGEPRWSCLAHLADAIRNMGEAENSVVHYEEALSLIQAALAKGEESKQTWLDLAAISFNAADAFRQLGKLELAHSHFLQSAKAERNAASPAETIIAAELEAFNIEIMQGHVRDVLPEIMQRLAQLEICWQQLDQAQINSSWQDETQAYRIENLARSYISALDVATMADFELEQWESALDKLEKLIALKQKLKRSLDDIAETRINLANAQIELHRFDEARNHLEACLAQFQDQPNRKAMVLSTLADLHHRRGDVAQAILQERRALALFEQLANPGDRAIAHFNLGRYLFQGEQSVEAAKHHLAALIYCTVAELAQILDTALYNYGIRLRTAPADEIPVPTVAALLALPEFAHLAQWLKQQGVTVDELQENINGLYAYAREQAFATGRK